MIINKNSAWSIGILLLAIAGSLPIVRAQTGVSGVSKRSAAADNRMVKMLFMLKRKPGMSREDFIKYYESHHARLGEKYVPNAVRYVRRFLEPVKGPWSSPADDFDVVTELWFANQHEADRAMAHLSEPAIHDEIAADEARLFDRTRSRVYIVTEHESVVPNAGK